MENPKGISLVIKCQLLFSLLSNRETNNSFMIWTRINQEIILEDAVILQMNREQKARGYCHK